MKLFIFILLFAIQISVFSQQNYVHYTVKDGLPQMQCMKLFQDSKGYIWVATKGGISKYDGISFKNYTTKDGLPENQIIEIKEDEKGKIWVLTNSGLSVYSGDKFMHYPTKQGLFFKSEHLIFDNEQNIYLIDNYSLKTVIQFKNGVYTKLFSVKDKKGQFIRDLSFDKSNNNIYFLVSNIDDFFIYTITNGVLNSNFKKTSIISLNHEKKVLFKKNKSIEKKRLSLYNFNQKDTINIFNTNKIITDLTHINDSTFVFTEGKFNNNMPLNFIINNKLQSNPKTFDQINDILQDTENNVWIASEKGLYKLTPFNNYSEKDNMPNYVWAIQEDVQGKIWFATFSNSKYLYYKDKNTIIKHPTKVRSGFYMGAIKTLNNDLLFPYGSGIMKYDGDIFTEYKLAEATASLSIYEDPKTLKQYFGTYKGLQIRDSLGNYTINRGFVKGKNEVIQKIIKNKKGELWFVSDNSYGIINKKDTLIYKDKAINGGRTIYCDYKNNLWFGTNNGLYYYNYKKFFKIDHPELQTMIGSIIETEQKKIAYGGLRGIGILDLEKFYSYNNKNMETDIYINYYTQAQGFLGEEVGQNGIFKDSKGQIWVPTNNNVVMFNPKDLQKNTKPPYTYITKLKTSKDNINWNITNSDNEFSYKQSNIEIDFIGISHTSPNMVKYKYRLKGFNDSWSNETKNRNITYTNLAPNNYVFELIACNNNGVLNTKVVTHKFVIIAAWWQAIWFKLLVFLLVLFVIYIFIDYSYKQKSRKTELANRLNELQLQAMQSQLYPHLLYNTASATGSIIYKENKEKAYDFVVKLSKFMRLALEDTRKMYKTLAEEMSFVEAYLQLQKIRFPERFNCEINIAKNTNMELKVPQMIVQTYVENAIKYGLEPLKKGGFYPLILVKIANRLKL